MHDFLSFIATWFPVSPHGNGHAEGMKQDHWRDKVR
jgi:hypothetical protein